MTLAAFYSLVFVLGILSMGFQLLASRLLGPHFGSGIDVWAWLISTFLAAFSTGSMLGGWISSLAPSRRFRVQVITALIGVVGFALTAFEAQPRALDAALRTHPILSSLETAFANPNLGLCAACMLLFFFPVTALSTFGPQCVQFLAGRGTAPGAASGTVYGVSTIGNIAGVMLTALVMLPNFGVSRLMIAWLVVAIGGLGCLIAILRSGSTVSPS